MNTSRSRKPVAKKMMVAASVISSYGLGSMKTIAPLAPTSHTSARCNATTRGAVTDKGKSPAVAAYAITHSSTYATQLVHTPERGSESFSFEHDLFGKPVSTLWS